MNSSTQRRESWAVRHLVPALIGALLGAFVAGVVVTAAGLHGAAAAIVALVVLGAFIAGGWSLGRRSLVERI